MIMSRKDYKAAQVARNHEITEMSEMVERMENKHMTDKHTKGPWHSDGIYVRNEGGLIAGAMISVRLSAGIDETRLEGESWLSMRGRTQHLRDYDEDIEKDLLNLIAAAPEMLEILEKCLKDELNRRKKLLNKSTAAAYSDARVEKMKAAIAKAKGLGE